MFFDYRSANAVSKRECYRVAKIYCFTQSLHCFGLVS